MRGDGRELSQLRPLVIEPHFLLHALGSALVRGGDTRVVCAVSRTRVPPFVETGGWLTAEYAMMPGSTKPRASRDPGGRGKEIARLIGRSLRAAVKLDGLRGAKGPVALVCDCDVLDADGGTRTASITGAYVALRVAMERLLESGDLDTIPMEDNVAAVSVGLVEVAGEIRAVLDLPYEEDSRAHVDLNVVARRAGNDVHLIEVQGTAEMGAFSRSDLNTMLDLAEIGLRSIFIEQDRAIEASRAKP